MVWRQALPDAHGLILTGGRHHQRVAIAIHRSDERAIFARSLKNGFSSAAVYAAGKRGEPRDDQHGASHEDLSVCVLPFLFHALVSCSFGCEL